MKERPILFSAPMVRAILAGRKTQTRRLLKPQPPAVGVVKERTGQEYSIAPATWDNRPNDFVVCGAAGLVAELCGARIWNCPHGAPGDRLWVQESYHVLGHGSVGPSLTVKYLADGAVRTCEVSAETYDKFRARKTTSALGGRFMYRDISRITLELTAVRVERLNDISEADAIAEGLSCITKDDGRTLKYGIPDRDGLPGTDDDGWPWAEWNADPRVSYRTLWESINGAGSWAANPWVWVETFRRVDA